MLQVGKENVHTALSLVGYEKDVETAMKFVFGGSFVCNKTEHAKKVSHVPSKYQGCKVFFFFL